MKQHHFFVRTPKEVLCLPCRQTHREAGISKGYHGRRGPCGTGRSGFARRRRFVCLFVSPHCDGNGNPIVKLLPPVSMGTGNAHLPLAWDGDGTGSWGVFHSCGGMGVERDAIGDGTGLVRRIEEVGSSGEMWGKPWGHNGKRQNNGEYMGLTAQRNAGGTRAPQIRNRGIRTTCIRVAWNFLRRDQMHYSVVYC